MTEIILKLNEYQAANLSALLRLVSVYGVIVDARKIMDECFDELQIIYPNNGDWLGEIRWMLEPNVSDSFKTNFGELPPFAARKGNFLPIDYHD
jgi:hypothetical protein